MCFHQSSFVQIPLDCLCNSGIEIVFWFPSKLSLDLGRVDCISSVMARAVFYVFDQRFRFVQSFQDGLYYLKVCSLVVSANVVNLAYFTFMDNQVDCFAMVGYVQPVSDISHRFRIPEALRLPVRG